MSNYTVNKMLSLSESPTNEETFESFFESNYPITEGIIYKLSGDAQEPNWIWVLYNTILSHCVYLRATTGVISNHTIIDDVMARSDDEFYAICDSIMAGKFMKYINKFMPYAYRGDDETGIANLKITGARSKQSTIDMSKTHSGTDSVATNHSSSNQNISVDVPINNDENNYNNASEKSKNTGSNSGTDTNTYNSTIANGGTIVEEKQDINDAEIYQFYKTKYDSIYNLMDKYIIRPMILEYNTVI